MSCVLFGNETLYWLKMVDKIDQLADAGEAVSGLCCSLPANTALLRRNSFFPTAIKNLRRKDPGPTLKSLFSSISVQLPGVGAAAVGVS